MKILRYSIVRLIIGGEYNKDLVKLIGKQNLPSLNLKIKGKYK
jgi:hypothetical protein